MPCRRRKARSQFLRPADGCSDLFADRPSTGGFRRIEVITGKVHGGGSRRADSSSTNRRNARIAGPQSDRTGLEIHRTRLASASDTPRISMRSLIPSRLDRNRGLNKNIPFAPTMGTHQNCLIEQKRNLERKSGTGGGDNSPPAPIWKVTRVVQYPEIIFTKSGS